MSKPRDHQPTVLVVEDEGLLRLDAVEILRDAGFDVLEAADASEALRVVDARKDIDVIFTDINMPGSIDGLELARRVHESCPRIRLVLTSGAVRPLPQDIPQHGAFIPKPYTPEAMTQALRRVA